MVLGLGGVAPHDVERPDDAGLAAEALLGHRNRLAVRGDEPPAPLAGLVLEDLEALGRAGRLGRVGLGRPRPAASASGAASTSAAFAAFALGSAFAFGGASPRARRPRRRRSASRRARRRRRPASRRPPRAPCGSRPWSASVRSSAALLPPNRMSLIRRTVSSWRWPFFTRRRAFGRYLKAMTLSPRVAPSDLGLDGGAVDDGGPDGGLGPVGHEEHALQRDRLAGLDVEQLNLELGADLDAVLLPAGLDDCVHGSSEESDGGRVATAARTC